VRDHAHVCNRTGTFQHWFADHAMQVAMVRPGRYLFGGATVALLPSLMQQLLAMLLVPSAVVS
jgi:hypothetical protein